jgi:uncharacterized membrane protein
MFDVTLEQGHRLGTMFLVLAVSILLVSIFYFHTFRTLRRGQWQILLLLRVIAIVIIVLLLFRPVFSYHQDLQTKRAVVFLLDNSASMSIADDATKVTRFNQARKLIEQWCGEYKKDFEIQIVAFAEKPRRLDDVKDLAAVVPDGKATAIGRAIELGSSLSADLDLEAMILFSDGIDNSIQKPAEIAATKGKVIHAVGVGASLKSDINYRDVMVTGINCPDRMMVNNKADIVALVDAVGLGGRVVQVVLEEDDKPLETKDLTLDDVEGNQEVSFEFRPTQKGRHVYKVRVPPLAEEKIKENNQRTAVSLVVEPGMRVLYLEGTLRAEYGALVDRFLSKDPDLQFCSLVQTRANRFLKRTNMVEGASFTAIPTDAETINKFDVFILGDIDSSYIKRQQQQMIADRVKNGGGLIMLGGYHSLGPGGYAGTPLGEILPVQLGSRDIGQNTEPFLPLLTPEGVHHPVFANIAGFFPTKTGPAKIGGLPSLNGCTRILSPRPSATILAVAPPEAGGSPLIAVQRVGKGWSMVFTGDTTRNWQQGPRAMDRKSPFLQFWGQIVRFLAGRSTAVDAKASVSASTNKAYYDPDEPVEISAIVRDEQGEATDKAKVVAKIRGPGGRPDQADLPDDPGPGGHYKGSFKPETAGTYEIVVEARMSEAKDAQPIKAEKQVIDVGRPNMEFEKLDVDEKTLAKIAAVTGGRYVHISAANHLMEQLDRSQRKKTQHFEKPLFSPPLFWLVFVGVLTAEWILRRRFQLR